MRIGNKGKSRKDAATLPTPTRVPKAKNRTKRRGRTGLRVESGEQQELLNLRHCGYVVNRGTNADQEMANRYYHFCWAQNFTWVQVKPGRKVACIRVELCGPVQRLDEQARKEVGAL